MKNIGKIIWIVAVVLLSSSFSQNRISVNGKDIFASGMNLAWVDFANDVADDPIDENRIRSSIQSLRDAGGNALRWWLFTNASKSPTFDASGLVNGIGANTVANVKKVLDIAEENGVVVSLCLLSFDLMQDSQVGSWNHMSIANNKKLLQTDEGIQAFIDNALVPLLTGVGSHSAIMSWEIFNEPEGMSNEFGWTPNKVSMADIQKVTNRVAAAIHANAPGALVSSGTHSFYANSDVPTCGTCKNYYSDSELIAAGGEATGTLDFYQVHFYPEHFSDDRNPFVHPASYWGLSKPVVIGEFPAGDWNGTGYKSTSTTHLEAVEYAYNNGYAGAMSWDMNGFNDGVNPTYTQNLTTSSAGLTSLYTNYPTDIKIKDVTRGTNSGNGVMQVTYASVNGSTGASIERQRSYDLTGETTLSLKARVVTGSDPFSFRMVMKTGDSWDWKQNESFCNVAQDTSWTQCDFDLSAFANWDDATNKADLSNVKSFLLQSYSAGFSGDVQFDDVHVGSTVIDDFNTEFDLWSVAGGMDGGDAITEIKTVFVEGTTTAFASSNRFQGLSSFVQNGELILNGLQHSSIIRIYSLTGKLLQRAQLNPYQNRVQLASLAKGVVQLVVENQNQKWMQRIVLQ